MTTLNVFTKSCQRLIESVSKPCSSNLLGKFLRPPPQESCKKRRHAEATEDDGFGCSFVILPHSRSTPQKPLRLVPKLLLRRSCLPLAYLDLSLTTDLSACSHFFSGHIQALDGRKFGTKEEQQEAQVLIVEEVVGSKLFAIEPVHYGAYALCKLCDWVSLHDFGKAPSKSGRFPSRDVDNHVTSSDNWWKSAAINKERMSTRRLQGQDSQSRHVKLSLKPPSTGPKLPDDAVDFQPSTQTSSRHRISREPPDAVFEECLDDQPVLSAEDLLNVVGAQYLELLYINKASLAYFTKGPLSRARTAFQQSEQSHKKITELVGFLRGNVLSISTNDKKYSVAMVEFIKEIPLGVHSGDQDLHDMSSLGAIIRRSKKRKNISKSGLRPGEEEYVARWWMEKEESSVFGGPNDTQEDRIRSLLIQQRARETQLQIILILEILALEASLIPSIEGTGSSDRTQDAVKTAKKPQDLTSLLDVLIDRLCIWQSMSLEDAKFSDFDRSAIFQQQEAVSTNRTSSDHLRDFCTEVVVPFYASRLPDLYKSICKKLGHGASSPVRRPLAMKPKPKPGKPKIRKPLERVITDEHAALRRPRGLVRSSTDSFLPTIKRELSEISLPSIPIGRITLEQSRRREVDLSTVPRPNQAKIQRKAAIDEELREAITAMKRPNARMAVRELVESADRRTAGLRDKSRKSKNPIRNPFADGVQIMATPKGNRTRDIWQGLPPRAQSMAMAPQEPEMIPPSSDLRVPSSSIRSKDTALAHNIAPTASLRKPRFPSQVEQTPSRRSAKLAWPPQFVGREVVEDEDELCRGSPELPRHRSEHLPFKHPVPRIPSAGSIHGTPSRKISSGALTESPRATNRLPLHIQGTPVKGARSIAKERLHEKVPESQKLSLEGGAELEAGKGAGKSIYESLGWDDDDDELL